MPLPLLDCLFSRFQYGIVRYSSLGLRIVNTADGRLWFAREVARKVFNLDFKIDYLSG